MPTAPLRLTVAVLVLAASSLPASAGDRYDPSHTAFDAMINTIVTNALRPRYQAPLPVYTYVPGPVTGAQPRPPVYAASPRTQEQWKQSIVAEAQRFCDAYPRDSICHFQDDR